MCFLQSFNNFLASRCTTIHNRVTQDFKYILSLISALPIELVKDGKYFEFSQLILGYQLKLCGVALVNGKYIKHVGHSILNAP